MDVAIDFAGTAGRIADSFRTEFGIGAVSVSIVLTVC